MVTETSPGVTSFSAGDEVIGNPDGIVAAHNSDVCLRSSTTLN
jgi:hypothetical protein